MVMPCCHLCYVKYINEDGSLDEAVFKKAYKEIMEQEYRVSAVVCKCMCHRKDKNVRH